MSETNLKKEIHAGVSRRSFLKGCAIAAATLGLSPDVVPEMVEAVMSPRRPPVVWLHFQECTGCTEALLRAARPDIATLILNIISLDYHETIMAAAGKQAEENLHNAINKNDGKFICVVEGAIPAKDGGIYCKIGGRTAMEILNDVAPRAKAILPLT